MLRIKEKKMNKTIKKIIAREGLIIATLIIVGIIIEQFFWWRISPAEGVLFALRFVAPYLCLNYILIRFALWAVRILRKK